MTLLLLEKGLVLEGHQNRGYLGSRVEPKIGGGIFPPKWMVKIRKKPIRIDDLGGNTPIFGNTHIYIYIYLEPVCPLFLGVDLPSYGSNVPKYGSFGF